jgi:hypothetical protein
MIGQCAVELEYGMYMSEFSILGPAETSQVVLGALLPLDVPVQVKWHMRGLIRNGGSEEQLKYAMDIVTRIVKELGVNLTSGIPPLSVVNE